MCIRDSTSGLLMVAKSDRAHGSLSRQLQEHSITRKYKAIVCDNIKEQEGTVDRPIAVSYTHLDVYKRQA